MRQQHSRNESHLTYADSRHAQHRPAPIGELAEQAMKFIWDPSVDSWDALRMAERCRARSWAYNDEGGLERLFIYFTRATIITLEKLPTHPTCRKALTGLQQENLSLRLKLLRNGGELLDSMAEIKPTLVDRFNNWRVSCPHESLLPLFDNST
ncbi:hypothetical protein AN958_11909 [Leucoagaricus sp. SymC.cos]|nr:hypothetical protein AN958_11909 [Leucoagaricus sp. SymC.cos]